MSRERSDMSCIIDIFRKRRLRKDGKKDAERIFPAYNAIGSLIFLYNITSREDIDTLNECCRIFLEQKLKYDGFVYVRNGKLLSAAQNEIKYGIRLFGRRQVSLIGTPKPRITAQIPDNGYDVLLNFNADSSFAAKYLVATIKSGFRIAMREEKEVKYDMIISGSDGALLGKSEFADRVCYYLESINSAKEKRDER